MKLSKALFGLAVSVGAFHAEASADLTRLLETKSYEQVEQWQSDQLALTGERTQRALACRIELQLQKPPVHCFSVEGAEWKQIEHVLRVPRQQLDGLCAKNAKNITANDDVPELGPEFKVSAKCQKILDERRADIEYATRSESTIRSF